MRGCGPRGIIVNSLFPQDSSAMKFHLISLAAALALPLAANALAAQTDSADKHVQAKTAAAKPHHAAKPPAAKASAAKKTAAAKASAARKAAPAKNKKKTPDKTAKAVAPAASEPNLTEAELAISRNIQTGTIQCELGASVTVTPDDKHPGYFQLASGKRRYHMHPVESRTGAIRMEDPAAGALWLQLGSKSMLMDQKLGQRLADECVTPRQREYAAQLSAHPAPSLLAQPKH